MIEIKGRGKKLKVMDKGIFVFDKGYLFEHNHMAVLLGIFYDTKTKVKYDRYFISVALANANNISTIEDLIHKRVNIINMYPANDKI